MIEYKNVALRYDEKLVLKDVNLTINDGEFMVLVGHQVQEKQPC